MNLNSRHTNKKHKKNYLSFLRTRSIQGMLSYTPFLIVIYTCCIKKESKITCSLNKDEKPCFLSMDIHVLIPSVSPMVPWDTECSTVGLLIFLYPQSCSWALLSTKHPQVHSHGHINSFLFTFSSKQTKSCVRKSPDRTLLSILFSKSVATYLHF